jgi:hypothetical protein
MATFQVPFDAQQFKPQYAFVSGLPEGVHPVIISASEWTPPSETSKSTSKGHMLVLTLECIDGPGKGQSQKDWILLYHDNPDQVRKACEKLAAYCAVLNVPRFNDSNALHNIPFLVRVAKQRDSDFMEIKDIMYANGAKIGSNGVASGAPGGQQQPQGQPNFGGQPQQQPQQQPQGQPQQGFGGQPGGQPQQGGQPGGQPNWNGAPQGGGPVQGQPQQQPQGQQPQNGPGPGNWQQPGGQPTQQAGPGPGPGPGQGPATWQQNQNPGGASGGQPGWGR